MISLTRFLTTYVARRLARWTFYWRGGGVWVALLMILSWTMPAWATGVYDLPRLTAGTDTYLIDQAEAISLANEQVKR